MKTIVIKDLAHAEQLDAGAMSAVRGGFRLAAPSYSFDYSPKDITKVSAVQDMAQIQSVGNETGVGSALFDDVWARNSTSQKGANNISVH